MKLNCRDIARPCSRKQSALAPEEPDVYSNSNTRQGHRSGGAKCRGPGNMSLLRSWSFGLAGGVYKYSAPPELARPLSQAVLTRGDSSYLCPRKKFIYSSTMNKFPPTERTTLKRLPKRAVYDREAVYRILDEGFICHVGFVVDARPFVIPTGYARVDDKLLIHGSQALLIQKV